MDRFLEPTIAEENRMVPSRQADEAYDALQDILSCRQRALTQINEILYRLVAEVEVASGGLTNNFITNAQFALARGAVEDAIDDLTYDVRAELRDMEG